MDITAEKYYDDNLENYNLLNKVDPMTAKQAMQMMEEYHQAKLKLLGIADVRRSFSLEDLKKAFEAGDELVNQDWHEQEFCIGERCRCKGVKLKYSNFDEWVSQNYV